MFSKMIGERLSKIHTNIHSAPSEKFTLILTPVGKCLLKLHTALVFLSQKTCLLLQLTILFDRIRNSKNHKIHFELILFCTLQKMKKLISKLKQFKSQKNIIQKLKAHVMTSLSFICSSPKI